MRPKSARNITKPSRIKADVISLSKVEAVETFLPGFKYAKRFGRNVGAECRHVQCQQTKLLAVQSLANLRYQCFRTAFLKRREICET